MVLKWLDKHHFAKALTMCALCAGMPCFALRAAAVSALQGSHYGSSAAATGLNLPRWPGNIHQVVSVLGAGGCEDIATRRAPNGRHKHACAQACIHPPHAREDNKGEHKLTRHCTEINLMDPCVLANATQSVIGTCHPQGLQDPSLLRHVFIALVLPVLNYGAELWCGYFPHFLEDNYFTMVPAEMVHSILLRWHTCASKGTHRRVLCQAGGGLPLGAHWLRRAAAFWTHLVFADPQGLAIARSGMISPYLQKAGRVGLPSCFPSCCALVPLLLHLPVCCGWCLPPCLTLSCRSAMLVSGRPLQLSIPGPAKMPASHLSGRTQYSFAAWFRDLTSSLRGPSQCP